MMCLANIVIALHRRWILFISTVLHTKTSLCGLMSWCHITRATSAQFTSAVKFASLLTTGGREWYHTTWRRPEARQLILSDGRPRRLPPPTPTSRLSLDTLPFTFFLISRYCICSTQRPYCINEIYTMSLQCCHWSMLLCYTHKNGFDLRGKYRVYFLLTQARFTLYFCDLCRLLGRL